MESFRNSRNQLGFCLIIFLVLGLDHVWGNPLPKHGESNSDGDGGSTTKVVIPAIARKAGGQWRPEVVKSESGSDSSNQDEPESEQVRSESSESEEDYDNYDKWDYDSCSEEVDCPRSMYYHIRGKKCVPLRCPGGNKRRDQMTGECIPENTRKNFGYFNPEDRWLIVPRKSHARLTPAVQRSNVHQKTVKSYSRTKTMPKSSISLKLKGNGQPDKHYLADDGVVIAVRACC